MIVFDLRCGGGHVFEAWFASSASFETQAAAGQVVCPLCGDGSVTKAPMAPAVPAKANGGGGGGGDAAPDPAAIKAALRTLAAAQARALEGSLWVGPRFAAQARAMHDGKRDQAPIHGQATLAEARLLIEDGVPIAPLPFPVVPPDAVN